METETPEIVILCLLSLVMVTACDALVEPTDWLPKLMDEGIAFTYAYAAVPKASKIVTAAATV